MALADREKNTVNTGQEPFAFLRLPVEVREMIYHHHLTSAKILPRHQFFTQRWTPIDLLYVSRTIYNEAFFHLYTKGEFVLAIRPGSIFGLSTCWGTDNVSASVGLEPFVKSKKILHLIRHIALHIHWPSADYPRLMNRYPSRDTPTTDEQLQQTMTIVGTMLSRLPALRIIDVSWLQMAQSRECAPPKYKIPAWLRGLKQVRRKNEKVLIRMPRKGSISTEQLSRDQTDLGYICNTLKEIREDVQELQGRLREVYR